MLDSAMAALASLADPSLLIMLLIGTVAGLIMGLIPGLGGTGAVAILLPITFGMEPPQALALLIGALAVVHTSDTVSAVLLGAPGSASASVTMLDGYSMAKKGQAARALTLAFLSSMAGGIIGAIGLTLAIPLARPLVLSFASPELFMLTVLGVALAAVLSRGNIIKGVSAGLLGLILGMVGTSPTTAEERFTFGSLFLGDGLSLVAVALGIFGLAEIASRASQRRGQKENISLGGGWGQGIREWLTHWTQVIRGALIGIWAGVLPGVGATAGTWLAYGQAVATAKDKRQFGKGDPRGIVGPESANNSVEAGDLIPTLLFGIPGGVPSAMLLGMLLTYGIQPGPSIITEHLDLMYLIVWSFAIASILGALFCFLSVKQLAKLTKVPFAVLAAGLVADHAPGLISGRRPARRPLDHDHPGRLRLAAEIDRVPQGPVPDRFRPGHPAGTLLLPHRQPLRRVRLDGTPRRAGLPGHPGPADDLGVHQVRPRPPPHQPRRRSPGRTARRRRSPAEELNMVPRRGRHLRCSLRGGADLVRLLLTGSQTGPPVGEHRRSDLLRHPALHRGQGTASGRTPKADGPSLRRQRASWHTSPRGQAGPLTRIRAENLPMDDRLPCPHGRLRIPGCRHDLHPGLPAVVARARLKVAIIYTGVLYIVLLALPSLLPIDLPRAGSTPSSRNRHHIPEAIGEQDMTVLVAYAPAPEGREALTEGIKEAHLQKVRPAHREYRQRPPRPGHTGTAGAGKPTDRGRAGPGHRVLHSGRSGGRRHPDRTGPERRDDCHRTKAPIHGGQAHSGKHRPADSA